MFFNHPWIQTPTGVIQPDFVLSAASQKAILVEAKLTWKPEIEAQQKKYIDALGHLGFECFPVSIVRNLTPKTPRSAVVGNFLDIFPYSIWHWTR